MSIWVNKYIVKAYDANGTLICVAKNKNEWLIDKLGKELCKNGYNVKYYELKPMIGFGG